jgi:2-C-methyl-D-erythritol 2,4-cyclodiphosphate synthase
MTDPGFRTGIGFDFHRLVAGRDLIIGGVKIPYEKGLLGHSDAGIADPQTYLVVFSDR